MINTNKNKLFQMSFHALFGFLLIFIMSFFLVPNTVSAANETAIYKDGIYCYNITNEANKEVQLIGIESTDKTEELFLPGTVKINDIEYTVISVNIQSIYYQNQTYATFYNSIKKLNIADTFVGTLLNSNYAFPNLETVEFYGKTVPKNVTVEISDLNKTEFLFIVPEGMEKAYANVISFSLYYSANSDLYEEEIKLTPTIVSSATQEVEYGCFSINGFIYQMTKSAKDGIGEVQLVGISHMPISSYVALPEEITNNGYTYKLTKLCRFSLIGCGAKAIIVPDTVTEMESGVFDKKIELLFLSKNCKVIPRYLIIDENGQSNIRFIYVPEGVTTISDDAFNGSPTNKSSIILPTTIKSIGKESLYTFRLVTFLNQKPINNITAALKSGTTVKVKKSSISSYKSVLNSKVTVIAAMDIVKATKLSVNSSSVALSTIATKTLTGTLSKDSTETIYWFSTDTDLFDISSKGVINPKKAGTAYAIAYTRTSGLHKAVKIATTYQSITSGIYQYRITDAINRTVTLYSVKPESSTIKLNIPEKITYKNKTYTVTGVIADTEDTSVPLISDKYESNNIKEIIFSKNICKTIGYLGKMNHIKSITFLGKAPTAIRDWYADGGLLAFQVIIHVPESYVDAYASALWVNADYDTYSMIHYGCMMDYNIIQNGSDKIQRFVKDGILYTVTKQAGTKNGTVTVKGADVTLKEISVGGTVTNGKYTYDITEVSSYAFVGSNAEKIILASSISKVGSHVFNEKAKHIIWSKSCKIINKNLFYQSIEVNKLDYQTQSELTGKSDFYALETFIIPKGVTTIQNNVFLEGFGNLKSITIPTSVTKIGADTFNSITEVIYEKQ
jgi:hypothetical protein